MLRHFLLVIVLLSEVFMLQSQTVVLQPTSNLGKDAMIRIGDNGTSDGNTNFGTEVAYIAGRTNISGVWYKTRSLIQFDLSSIPQKAIITSATLTFYGVAHNNSGMSNASTLQRITGHWDENAVTWNNQPSTTGSGQFSLSSSTSSNQNYTFDVKSTVQDMLINPSGNYGWMLKLNNESTAATSVLNFASSDYTSTSGLTPKLEITYTLLEIKQVAASSALAANGSVDLTVSGTSGPYTYSWTNEAGSVVSTSQDLSSITAGAYKVAVTDASSRTVYSYALVGSKSGSATVIFQPDANYGSDASMSIKASTPANADANGAGATTFNTLRWTVGGLWQTNRSLISFDFSSIPNYAIVTSATLYLYGTDHATTGQSNACTFQRVTSPWTENFVTWNTQPSSSLTGKIDISATTTATENKALDVTSHVQDMIRYPDSNYGWLIKLNGEANNSYAKMIFASSDYTTDVTKRPKLVVNFYVPDGEETRNWTDVEVFDNSGNTITKSRTYYDAIGRTTQQQTLDIANGNVLAIANVFDEYGRPVLQTLPAPIYQTGIAYKNGFIKSEGSNYDYTHFASNNVPATVDNDETCPLGWYYSNNNNSEAYVASSVYPFSTVEYTNDPLSRVKRSAGVGEEHRMGSGHENKVYYMSNMGELDYAYGYRKSYVQSLDPSNSSEITADISLLKTVQVDPDGKISVVYTNSGGQTIASCLSGQGSTCASQKIIHRVDYWGEKGVNIHLPLSKIGTLKLPVDHSVYASEGNGTVAQIINYTITDLKTGVKLVPGTDYTFNRNSNSRAITFLNGYQNSEGFFRISFEYTDSYKTACLQNCYPLAANNYCLPNIVQVKYELDYSDWTLNYLDRAGRVVKTVSSQGLDCSYDPVTNHTVTSSYINKSIVKTPSCSTPLHTISTAPVTNYDQNLKIKVQVYSSGNCNTTEQSRYDVSPITPGSSTVSVSSISSTMQVESSYTPVTVYSSDQRQRLPSIPPDPKPQSRYSYFIDISLCGNTSSGTQLVPNSNYTLKPGFVTNINEMILDPYGYPNEIVFKEWNIEASTLAGFTDIRVKIDNIQIVKYDYVVVSTLVSAFHGYWQQSDVPFNYTVGMNGGAYDNMICKDLLGITSVLEKYPTSNHINQNLASTLNYNKLGQLIKSSSVDEGITNVVYDTEGKVRFTQNATQLANGGKFGYLVYDRAGRVSQIGEYDPSLSGDATFLVFQAYNTDGSVPSAPPSGTSVHSIINNISWSYPSRSTQQTYYAYDVAQSDFPTSTFPSYSQKYKDGGISKIWNTAHAEWFGYDDLGRPIWGVNSITGLTGYKTVNYTYNNDGLLDNYDYQKEVSGERFITKYLYDANKRLKEIQTSFNGSTYTTKQKLEYYLHGPLKRNELGGTLQGLDYVYTINGLLKSVNEPTLTSRDPGKDSYTGSHSNFKADVFGYTLDYYTNDYVRQNTLIETYTPGGSNTSLPNLYSGQVKSSRWKTTVPTAAQASTTHVSDIMQFSYKYDSKNQLTEAIFGTITAGTINGSSSPGTSPAFTEAANEYRLNNITYDKIGNIKTLNRQGKASSLPLDVLTYTYDSNKPNRLDYVSDGATSAYADDIKSGQTSSNYQYNAIGQLVKDVQSDYNYTYNAYGNVTAIKKTNGNNVVTIEYNALGLRQKKTSYDPGTGSVTGTVWYVYDNGGALLSSYSSATTQSDLQVYGAGRLGVYDRLSSSFVYELTDHVGNVRATVRDNAGTLEVLSLTDYFPHGSALPGRNYVSAIGYKYAYQGQEKDTETGFLNFELRQYDARLGRWFNPDPMGQYHSPYLAMGNNPVSMIDPTGGWSGDGYGDGQIYRPSGEEIMEAGGNPNAGGYSAAGAWDNGFENAADAWWFGYNSGNHFDVNSERTESYLSQIEYLKSEGYSYSRAMNAWGKHYRPRIDPGWFEQAPFQPVKPIAIDAVSVYRCLICPPSNQQNDYYDEQISKFTMWDPQWWKWSVGKLERDWGQTPPFIAQFAVNINPLASAYNVGNGIFGNGNDIMGIQQTGFGIGLNLLNVAMPIVKGNGFFGGSIGYTLKSDLNVSFVASEKALANGTFQYSTIAPNFLMNSKVFQRIGLQITSEFQPTLGPVIQTNIPAGTRIQLGFTGYQGFIPGSWLQIYTSKPVKFK